MRECRLPNGKLTSVLGIGGHYRHFEYGRFEETYAPVEPGEVEARAELIAQAIEGGVRYFDTTWFNEVEMLSKALSVVGVRDGLHVNGMVLGAFPGSDHFGMTERDYFDRYLDKRLAIMPGHRFDSFMINAIEEGYNPARCEALVRLLLDRKRAGDIGMIGFSCHNHALARQVADNFPDFELIMMAYNYKHRALERAFEGYSGRAALVAMKPMVWAEYGIPFNALNNLARFEALFGFAPDEAIATKALRFLTEQPQVSVTVCGVNTKAELDQLLAAGEGESSEADHAVLANYASAIARDNGAPLFLGGMAADNTRIEYFAASNLCGLLGLDGSGLTVRNDDRRQVLEDYKGKIRAALRGSAYSMYQ